MGRLFWFAFRNTTIIVLDRCRDVSGFALLYQPVYHGALHNIHDHASDNRRAEVDEYLNEFDVRVQRNSSGEVANRA